MQKKYRLKSSKSYRFLYNRGRSISNKYIVLIYLKSNRPTLKVGFTVSKKIGNAVTRNSIRRKMKESTRLMIPNITNGYSLVLLARKPIIDLKFEEINNSIKSLLIKTKLYINENDRETVN